jgi:hypothetical protein
MPRSTTNMSLRDLLVVVLAAVGLLAWGCSGVTLNRHDPTVVTPVAAMPTPDGPLDVPVTPPALTAPVSSTATWVADITPMSPPVVVSDETLRYAQGQSFGIGVDNSPFWVKIVVADLPDTTITGLIYQDVNENGTYELGESLVAGKEIRLVPSTACHIEGPIVATALSDTGGRYTLSGIYDGSFCIGLVGETGFDDGVNVALTTGQILTQVNLRAPNPSASVSGTLWNDTCLTDETGATIEGVCVPDGQGGVRADGVIQATEPSIPDASVYLQRGPCLNNDHLPIPASTDAAGRYVFTRLGPGTYCVSIHPDYGGNAVILLQGNWTFPGWGIGYQEINLQADETISSIDFGWDYER